MLKNSELNKWRKMRCDKIHCKECDKIYEGLGDMINRGCDGRYAVISHK